MNKQVLFVNNMRSHPFFVECTGVTLNVKQLQTLEGVNKAFREDFKLRRRMLLKRIDVTLQSFLWSNKAQGA